MPIVYEDVVRGRPRSAYDLPSSDREVLTETFAQQFEENPIAAWQRINELRSDGIAGKRLTAEQARAKLTDAGMESDIDVGAGITENALATLMDRKRVEKRRQETFALSDGGIGLGAARLGVGALTSLADPISAALNFVPIASQARYARMLAGARGAFGRAGVRAAVGAAEGAAGAALVEPLTYGMRRQEQADYDAVDSLLNVTLGGAVGAGLHTTVGGLSDLYLTRRGETPGYARFRDLSQEDAERVMKLQDGMRRNVTDMAAARTEVAGWSDQARRAVDDLVPPTMEERLDRLPAQEREALLRTATNQAAAGETVDIKAGLDAAELRLIESEVNGRLDAREAQLRQAAQPADDADRLAFTRAEVDQQLQGATRLRDESAATLSADAGKQAEAEAQRLAREDTGNRYAQDRAREGGSADDAVFPTLQRQAEENVARQRNFAKEQLAKANELIAQLKGRLDRANQIRSAEVDLDQLSTARRSAADARERIALLPEGPREHYGRRLDSVEAEAAAARTSQAPQAAADPEYRAATIAADQSLKTAPPDAPDALPAAMDELASDAETDARETAKRLGVEFKDAEMDDAIEASVKAERWARAAELATVCLTRGG